MYRKEFFKTLSDLDIAKVNLMKINIEGGEYPLLMHIADNDKLGLVDEYQIQFHNFIEDAEHKRESIIKSLSKTHKRTWCYTFVWENGRKSNNFGQFTNTDKTANTFKLTSYTESLYLELIYKKLS